MDTFQNIPDPRTGKAERHYFGEVIFSALAAMICGTDGFDITLGQLLVDRNIDEITVVPKLLRSLDIKRATVYLDAIGSQKKIAQEIHFGSGHCLLVLKVNQGTFHDDFRALLFEAALSEPFLKMLIKITIPKRGCPEVGPFRDCIWRCHEKRS